MRCYRTFWLLLLSLMYRLALADKMYKGTITFKHKGVGPASGLFQSNVMARNIERAIKRIYQDETAFGDVEITKIRVPDKVNKTSKIASQLAVDFNLTFLNMSENRTSHFELERLFSAVRGGHLGKVPLEAKSLVFQGISETAHAIPITQTQWPYGSYGLPKPKSGCPSNEWTEGSRYHDNENHSNENYYSNRSHLAGKVNSHGIEQKFCIHRDLRSTEEQSMWPTGKYCIFKKGQRCPTGLSEGWIRWDDEDSNIDFPNKVLGDVPEGIYGENTVVYFCCSQTGSKSDPIQLPYGPSFYLLAFGSPECQQVHNYEASTEYVQFDDEDQGNTNAHSRVIPYGPTEDPYNTRIYYCHYKPVPCEKLPNRFCLKRTSGTELEMEASRNRIISSPHNKEAHHGSAFATGSAIGAILFGVAVFAITTKRFLSFYEAAIAETRRS